MGQNRRSLPPGVDDDPVFGSMWIKAGTLKLIRSSKAQYNVICQFWGQQSAAKIKTRSDMPNNEKQRTQLYDIRCPVIYFVEYLKQMKHNLKLEVEGVGKVTLDISKFINKKKQVNIDSRQAFQHFNGFFQIIGTGSRKAGSIQIQMGCSFDPAVAYRELGEEAVQEMRQSYVKSCPANNHKGEGCRGTCLCHQLSNRRRQVIQQKQANSNDKRIAHSLDVQQRPQQQFDAQKYNREEPQVAPSQFIKKKSSQQIKVEQSQFPQIPQILTYSRLRLDYDPAQNQNLIKTSSQQSKQIEESERVQEISRKPMMLESQKEEDKLNKIQTPLHKLIESVEDSNYAGNEQTNQLFREFYGAQRQLMKDQRKQEKEEDQEEEVIEAKSPQILSRVINIDEQLKKGETEINKPIRNPPLLAHDMKMKKYSIDEPNGPTFRLISEKQMSYQDRPLAKTAPSNLILNLLVEIHTNSISFSITKNKFTIAYRPYGTKERTIAGPNFGDKITILNTVGEAEIRKMDKMPFIVQFWDCVTGKFLGIFKINLHKIKKGFLLNNRLNAISIKTNLSPTVIHRGSIPLNDISQNQTGHCSVYAAIGTSSQLNFYLNDPEKYKEQFQVQPEKPNSVRKQIKAQQSQQQIKQNEENNEQISKDQLLKIYNNFFMELDGHSSRVINELLALSSKQTVPNKEFMRIFKGFKQCQIVYNFMTKYIYRDGQLNGGIPFKDLSSSFDDYKQITLIVARNYKKNSIAIEKCFKNQKQKLQWLKKSIEQSQFYILSKQKIVNEFKLSPVSPELCKNYLEMFTNQFNIKFLEFTLKKDSNSYPTIDDLSLEYFRKIVIQEFYHRLLQAQLDADIIVKHLNNQQSISPYILTKYLISQKVHCSSWMLIHVFQYIKLMYGIQGAIGQNISLSHFYNWCVFMHRKSMLNQESSQQKQNQNHDSNTQNEKNSMNFNQKGKQIQKQHEIQDISRKQEEQQRHVQESKDQKQEGEMSAEKENIAIASNKQQEIAQKQQPIIYRHLFTLEPSQVQLQSPIRGNCQVSYTFPFQQQHIKSKSFPTMIDKFKYPLKILGTHGFSIQDSAQNYLGDNVVKFFVKIDGRIEYQGALHVDELLIEPNSREMKVIPLFSDRMEGMAGKMKIGIEYEKGKNSENTLGKQTTYQLFLPKNGYINYQIHAQVNVHKIKTRLNLKQQFYIALVFDIFHQAPNLKSLFPPISSKLFSAPQSIQLSGSIKLHLSSLILDYIKQKISKLSMNIIYYSKEGGNFQRKEVTYASIDLPMINVIKSQGIIGDYAFKNKLGMFVSLARCNIKYEKDSRNYLEANKTLIDRNRQNFWIILNFLEFINFQRSVSTINWIKFQFILRGKKYSTERAHLHHDAINPLRHSSIVLHLSQQDFHDLKMIPITIYTNSNEKYAIDINLKAVAQQLTHQKYSINNQYFIVVNQSSEPIKMRVGLKIYTMRGSPVLGSFIDSLSNNLETEIFNELTLPQEIGEYDKMLAIFKKNLKLTTKGLDEAINQLLISRHRDKLSFDFFTNQTYYNLDFTPIIVDLQSHFEFIAEYLGGEVSQEQVLEYIKDNNIHLSNFRKQFLQRFTFKELNKSKVDKNVEFLGIHDKVDLMTFIRKIKVHDPNDQSQVLDQYNNSALHNQTNMSDHYKELTLTILQGNNFHQLYNGIKPNAAVRIPDLGLETQVINRNSNPFFNEMFTQIIDNDLVNGTRKLRVEVYHCSSEDQNILIGQGTLNFPLTELKQIQPKSNKIVKVILNSTMSSRSKATLNIKLQFNNVSKVNDQTSKNYYQDSMIDSKLQSNDASRMDEIMQGIKQQMNYKGNLFESSDDQY